MKDAHKYNIEYPKTVVLIRSGVFCQTFDDAALVVSVLTDYQVKPQKNNHARCGFNLKLVPEIKRMLVKNHISYVELQTSPSNEQAEILDSYEGDAKTFDTMRDKGREIVNAKRQAENRLSAIRNNESMQKKSDPRDKKEWKFIDALCQGVHPLTGKPIKSLNLNDPDIIRSLYAVRDLLDK